MDPAGRARRHHRHRPRAAPRTTRRSWASTSPIGPRTGSSSCWDERDHHCLAVRLGAASTASPSKSSTPTTWPSSSTDRGRRPPVERIADGEEVGRASRPVELLSGHEMELVADVHKPGRLPSSIPCRWSTAWSASPCPGSTTSSSTPRRCRSSSVLHRHPRLPADRAAARRPGPPDTAFLERSAKPHDIAFVQGPNAPPPLLVLARRLGPCAAGGRHPRLQRHDRRRPHPPRPHPGQHDLLLRPDGHAQRGLHRRLRPDPDFPTITWTQEERVAGSATRVLNQLLPPSTRRGPDDRWHPPPLARRGPGPGPAAGRGLLRRGRGLVVTRPSRAGPT